MRHVETGELQAYLDHEVTSKVRADIESHINACAACATELNLVRAHASLFATAINAVDAPAPAFTALAAITAARRAERKRPALVSRTALSRAAVILIALGAIASATLPGSPVRSWISDALRSIGVLSQPAPAPAPSTESVPATALAPETGVNTLSIQPTEGRVRVILTDVADNATIRIRLVSSNRANVQATGGAAAARFKTAPGRVEVVGIEQGMVAIDLPRNVLDATVEADGRILFRKRGDEIQTSQPLSTSKNTEFVFRTAK
jgi:anti-sigma factor RsiW